MSAPQKIIDLVEDFKENKHEYTNPDIFDEENTKVKFLNPFFEELGWNVRNEGLSARFREVVFEDSIKVGKKTKAPDYSFRLGGERIFFVEAKKPSRDLAKDKEYAFQVRRYGWSAGLPLCILTDFEELAVYDTTLKPDKNQSASIGRIKYYKYTDYIDKWDEIYNIFSKDAVLSGKFDNFSNNLKGTQSGTSEVDEEFLKEIENWRLLLARNIALRNSKIKIGELNYAVQLIIDRIIFLRIAEDRKIERYGRLKLLLEKPEIYKNFCKICKEADEKYNSGLFHFNPYDKEDFTTDTYTLTLNIDDSVFKNIIKNLYYPDSPYEFSVISTEILGKVYEDFLGNVIRLTKGHQAKIEKKPDVQKAGGVYYTPQYIVDYIIENTLGKKIKGKTPNQISKISVIDPSCGSGSFLIRAYQYLLDYHLDYYLKLEKVPKDTIYIGKDGIERLTITEKKRILKNNIYGVDIDALAVEVTKLSLLLKVLEDQNKELIEQQKKLFHERALPNLSSNIKNGNSLISTDILDKDNLNFEEIVKINPFNWEKQYSEIVKNGGFDVIIGNPPWGALIDEKSSKYLKEINKDVIVRMVNSFMFFIYHFSKKIGSKGYFGMIIPDSILAQSSFKLLRKYLIDNFSILNILNMGNGVFKGINQPSAIIIFSKVNQKNIKTLDLRKMKTNSEKEKELIKGDYLIYPKDTLKSVPGNNFITDNIEDYKFLNKIIKNCEIKIKDIIDSDKKISRGASPDLKEAFIIKEDIMKDNNLEEKYIKNVVTGGFNIKPFNIEYNGDKLIYTTKKIKSNEIPNIKKFISQFKNQITCKEVKTGKHPIYSLHRPRNEKIYLKKDKIIGVITSDKLITAVDNNNLYATDGVYLFGTNENYNPYYVVAVLNSKLYTYIYRLYSLENGRMLAQVKPSILQELPFKKVSLEEQENIINLSKNMTETLNKLNNSNLPQEREIFLDRIDNIDQKINMEIYKIYGIKKEEIKIIEENL